MLIKVSRERISGVSIYVSRDRQKALIINWKLSPMKQRMERYLFSLSLSGLVSQINLLCLRHINNCLLIGDDIAAKICIPICNIISGTLVI